MKSWRMNNILSTAAAALACGLALSSTQALAQAKPVQKLRMAIPVPALAARCTRRLATPTRACASWVRAVAAASARRGVAGLRARLP